METKTKSFIIELPEDLFDEIIDNAADGAGYSIKQQVRGENNSITMIDETRSRFEFLHDAMKNALITNYKKGVISNASKVAAATANRQLEEKLKTIFK